VSRSGNAGQHGGDHGGGRAWIPAPYTKDKLGRDFREVRSAVFGPDERRQIQDMRRSGTVEAFAGGRMLRGCPKNSRIRWRPRIDCKRPTTPRTWQKFGKSISRAGKEGTFCENKTRVKVSTRRNKQCQLVNPNPG
jgi:hypothetical protein